MFLAQGRRGLEDWGGVCVTVAYESFDGSKEGCKRLRASANEIFSVYLRVTMSFSIFHFGQSFDIATWSACQFTHFGSFWQSSKLCPSPLHPAQTASLLHKFLVCPLPLHLYLLGGGAQPLVNLFLTIHGLNENVSSFNSAFNNQNCQCECSVFVCFHVSRCHGTLCVYRC